MILRLYFTKIDVIKAPPWVLDLEPVILIGDKESDLNQAEKADGFSSTLEFEVLLHWYRSNNLPKAVG